MRNETGFSIKGDTMKETIHLTLTLKPGKGNLSSFSPLLQQGFWVTIRIGTSIKQLLCDQFAVEADYLMQRISTILLDGKPVDDVETASLKDGSTLALAAAMPGLVGATMRRGGYYAALRNTITHQENGTTVDGQAQGKVKIKLFSQIIPELGPLFLEAGIGLERQDAGTFFENQFDSLKPIISSAEKDGQKIDPNRLATLKRPEDVILKVIGAMA
jgi:hypothetical protein